MAIYYNAGAYIRSKSDMKAKIQACNDIIDALILLAADAASNNGVKEYMLDNGQTRIRQEYRSIDEIQASITGMERVKQMFVNRRNGRTQRIVPGSSIV